MDDEGAAASKGTCLGSDVMASPAMWKSRLGWALGARVFPVETSRHSQRDKS